MDQEKAMNNENLPAKGVEFYLSDDATEVHACLKDATEALDKKRIVYSLSEIDIKDGIRYDAIHQMIQEKRVGQLYLVAECKKPVNGKDGWYEFLFDTDVDTKPKIGRAHV